MKKKNYINFQKSNYYKKHVLKSVIYLKSVNPADNYIISPELKLVRGSKSDDKWYRLHTQTDMGWSEGFCRLTQDSKDNHIYNGIFHTHERTIIVSLQILPLLKFCQLKAFDFFQQKELHLITVA